MFTSKINQKLSNLVNFSIGKWNSAQGKYKGGQNIVLAKNMAIYFPIPKVACTSILHLCAEIIGMDNRNHVSVHDQYFPSDINIAQNLNDYRNYFKFAFVRNPWDRLVSCYSNKILPDSALTNRWYCEGVSRSLTAYNRFRAGMPFDEFVEIVIDIPELELEKHLRSQYTFISNEEAGVFVDFVGRFENLSCDINQVLEKINRFDVDLPHLQTSKRYRYQDYYNDDTQEKVRKKYEKDIQLFGYSF